MVDFETVRFISLLQILAKQAEHGFFPKSRVDLSVKNPSIIYDDEAPYPCILLKPSPSGFVEAEGFSRTCYPMLFQIPSDQAKDVSYRLVSAHTLPFSNFRFQVCIENAPSYEKPDVYGVVTSTLYDVQINILPGEWYVDEANSDFGFL